MAMNIFLGVLFFCLLVFACYTVFGQGGPQSIASFGRVGIMTPTPAANLHVVGTAIVTGNVKTGSVSSNGAISGTTIAASGDITTPLHYLNTSGAPTLGAGCGTGATVTAGSNNFSGEVTTGSGAGNCVVTFANAYPNHAFCAITAETNVAPILNTPALKTSFSINSFNSTGYQYVCSGN